MADRRSDSAGSDLDSLFRLGVATGLSDRQLLERFVLQSGSDSQLAFEVIVRRHGPLVLGVCRRVLGHHQSAEDAFQATFLVLALRARTIRIPESLGAWLHGVATRIARRALASGRRQREEALPAEELSDPNAHDPASAELDAILDEEVGRLPDKYRLPMILCYLEGQTQDEAARALGWTKGTVSGRLARAKDLLRRRLTRRGLAPSAGLLAAGLTSRTASAAVPPSLLSPTIRAAIAASLSGAEAGLVTSQVRSLVRGVLKWMLLGRIARTTAHLLVFGLGAAAIAMPILKSGDPALPRNRDGGDVVAGKPVSDRPQPVATAQRLDRFGDPLPPRVRLRLGTIQRRHTRGVVGIAFTSDGSAAVSVQDDGIVRFWDPERGRLLHSTNLLGDPIMSDRSVREIAMAPNGEILAALGFARDPGELQSNYRVWIWALKSRRPVRTIEVTAPEPSGMVFSPDGGTLATGGIYAGEVRLWDVATGARRSTIKIGNRPTHSLAFTPDGKALATSELGSGMRLWDLAQGRATLLADRKSGQAAPRFSPDGRLMAVSKMKLPTVVQDRATGREKFQVPGGSVAFAPDGRSLAVTGSEDGTLAIFDTETGRLRGKAALGWGLRPSGPAFSPNGRRVIAECGGVLRFFEADSGREQFATPEAHQGGVSAIRYTPDGRTILTAGDDGTIRRWDATDGRPLWVISHIGRVHLLAVSSDGRSLATAGELADPSVSIWDLATGQLRRKWPKRGGDTGAEALAFSVDGDAVLTYGRDGTLAALEIATGRERAVVPPRLSLKKGPGFYSWSISAALAPGNRFLAVKTSDTAFVADLATGAERFSVPCYAMAFAPDGRTLAVATPARPEKPALANGMVRTNGWIAEAITLLGLDSGNSRRIDIPKDQVTALALSPDGKLLAVAGGWHEPTIRLYRTDQKREIETFAQPAAITRINGPLAFSPDGRSLAAGLNDTTVLIWDVREVR